MYFANLRSTAVGIPAFNQSVVCVITFVSAPLGGYPETGSTVQTLSLNRSGTSRLPTWPIFDLPIDTATWCSSAEARYREPERHTASRHGDFGFIGMPRGRQSIYAYEGTPHRSWYYAEQRDRLCKRMLELDSMATAAY